MNRIPYIILSVVLTLMALATNAQEYKIFQYDNGDDYIREGLRRIFDSTGKIGYADDNGKVIIAPRFAFAFPFEDGVAKVTDEGRSVSEGEYYRWVSPSWYFIDHNGNEVRRERRYAQIEQRLETFVKAQDARIGIAVIINGKDTVSVNGSKDFPMMSVFKFPQALAVADYCRKSGIGLTDSIFIKSDEMKENTWSPMRDKYGIRDIKLSVSELIDFILQQSDNNASDVLFRVIGGTSVADSLMKSLGYSDILITHTEEEMHRDPYLCYLNRSTPIEMARLFDRFYREEMRHDSQFHEFIAASMMSCQTGLDRLPAPLMHTDAMIGHKTGTGDRNSQGRIMAVNDAGYIYLPDKTGYAIAVFVADSAYDITETSKIIADISEIVFKSLI
ncbi:MAG: class A beta-lactamase [Duncaniella sp.]|nr:class A beta-lactamase [Duncaniella sp.]